MAPVAGGGPGLSLVATPTTKNQLSGVGLTYDLAGDVITDNQGHTSTYDAEGRVITANGETYGYDGDGNRVLKKDSTGLIGSTYWYGADGSPTDEQTLPAQRPQSGQPDPQYLPQWQLAIRGGFYETFWPALIVLPDQLGSSKVTRRPLWRLRLHRPQQFSRMHH